MISGIRQKTIVRESGKIEISSQDTTEYLLSTEANRRHLFQALKDLGNPESYIYVNPDNLQMGEIGNV